MNSARGCENGSVWAQTLGFSQSPLGSFFFVNFFNWPCLRGFQLGPAVSLSSLILQASDSAPLTAAQQRFNALLARIELLSGQIQRLEAWSDRHRHAHIQALREAVQLAQAHRKSLLLFLHERLQTADFSDRQQHMARGLVRGLISQLSVSADPQVQALAEGYVSEEEAQEASEAQAEAAQRMRERIEEALGQPLEKPSQYQTPEEVMAAGMRQWQRQQEVDEARKAAKRAARKAQKQAQKQAQKKSAAAENGQAPPAVLSAADAQSAMRTIFRQLASALHPDREPDDTERLRKTALMSEVNAAYEKNDLTTLLRLQMQLTQVNPQSTTRLADAQLIAMASLLKAQIAALEDDLDQLQSRLSRELCLPVQAGADEAVLAQSLLRIQADQRHSADSLAADLRRIQNDAELKRWLKAQWQLAKATFA